MKDKLPNLRDLSSYEEVLTHLIKSHGEVGKSVVADEDQMPFVWHEYAHLAIDMGAGTWDHEHYGDTETTVSDVQSLIERILTDESFAQEFLDSITDEENQASLKQAFKNALGEDNG